MSIFLYSTILVTIIGNIIIGDNWLFQITNKQQACDVHIMSTTEGIYISLDLRATQLKTSNIELDMKTHFMLAEIDFRIGSILRIFDKLNNKIETQICTIIKDKLMHMENYTFISLNNKNNIDRVLLKDNGELIVTNCVPITTITIATTNKYCYKHIPVSFMYNNNTLNGFLRENNLLTLESQVIDCNIKSIIELQFENKILSSDNGNKVMVTSRRNTNNLQLSFFCLSHISNMHNKELLDSYNLVNQVETLIRFDDVEGTYHIIISNPITILENHEDDIIPIPQTINKNFCFGLIIPCCISQ
jgi:hypothetical protein